MKKELREEGNFESFRVFTLQIVLLVSACVLGGLILSYFGVSSAFGSVMLGFGFLVLGYSIFLSLQGQSDGASVVVVEDLDVIDENDFAGDSVEKIISPQQSTSSDLEQTLSESSDTQLSVEDIAEREGGLGTLLVSLLERQGLEVIHDTRLSQKNFEFLARRGGTDFAVRVIPGSGLLSLKQVEGAIRDRVFTNCDGLMLASLGSFSPPARKLAESRNIKLADKEILSRWVEDNYA